MDADWAAYPDNGLCFVIRSDKKSLLFQASFTPHQKSEMSDMFVNKFRDIVGGWNEMASINYYHQISCRGWAKDVSIRDEQWTAYEGWISLLIPLADWLFNGKLVHMAYQMLSDDSLEQTVYSMLHCNYCKLLWSVGFEYG